MQKAYVVSLYGSTRITKYEELFDTVKGLCRKEERNYIYAYWGEPDYTMHNVGCCHESVTEIIRDIDQRVERLCRDLEDTLLIVTADHGHGDTGYFLIRDYPELDWMLERPPVIEARAASFYVKQEYLAQFPDLFKRLFGDQFFTAVQRRGSEAEYIRRRCSPSKIAGAYGRLSGGGGKRHGDQLRRQRQ